MFWTKLTPAFTAFVQNRFTAQFFKSKINFQKLKKIRYKDRIVYQSIELMSKFHTFVHNSQFQNGINWLLTIKHRLMYLIKLNRIVDHTAGVNELLTWILSNNFLKWSECFGRKLSRLRLNQGNVHYTFNSSLISRLSKLVSWVELISIHMGD